MLQDGMEYMESVLLEDRHNFPKNPVSMIGFSTEVRNVAISWAVSSFIIKPSI